MVLSCESFGVPYLMKYSEVPQFACEYDINVEIMKIKVSVCIMGIYYASNQQVP